MIQEIAYVLLEKNWVGFKAINLVVLCNQALEAGTDSSKQISCC